MSALERHGLLHFLRGQRLAAVASVSPDGAPQAAVVGIAVSERFEIIFDTLATTRKAINLRRNPRLALVIGGFSNPSGHSVQAETTVQYEGLADEPQGAELTRIQEVYYESYPDGPSRLSWPGLIYVRVRPLWIRYSDFNQDPPLIVEFTAADLAG